MYVHGYTAELQYWHHTQDRVVGLGSVHKQAQVPTALDSDSLDFLLRAESDQKRYNYHGDNNK